MDLAEFRAQFPVTRSRAYLFSGALTPAAIPGAGRLGRVVGELERRPQPRLHGRDDARGDGRSARRLRAPDRRRRRHRSRSRTTPAGRRTSRFGSWPSARATSSSTRARIRRAPTRGMPAATARCGSFRPTASRTPPEALAERIDSDTVAVCITHVAPFTGRRHDLRAIAAAAHAHGAHVLVYAAQSTGIVPIDVARDGVDALGDDRDEMDARAAGDRVSVPEPRAPGRGADARRRLSGPGRAARRMAAGSPCRRWSRTRAATSSGCRSAGRVRRPRRHRPPARRRHRAA